MKHYLFAIVVVAGACIATARVEARLSSPNACVNAKNRAAAKAFDCLVKLPGYDHESRERERSGVVLRARGRGRVGGLRVNERGRSLAGRSVCSRPTATSPVDVPCRTLDLYPDTGAMLSTSRRRRRMTNADSRCRSPDIDVDAVYGIHGDGEDVGVAIKSDRCSVFDAGSAALVMALAACTAWL